MATIKNVAIAGASGNMGQPILNALLTSKNFNITVLTRPTSKTNFPPQVTVAHVDYNSVESLTNALAGNDALISTLGSLSLEAEFNLINAALASKTVKRYIPSSFGSDVENPLVRQLPVFATKVKIEDHLKEVVKQHPEFSYTLVYNVAFLDWGLEKGFLFSSKDFKPYLYDGGDQPFSTTLLSDVADATVGVLLHLEETRNRSVRVQSIATTQNTFLKIAKKILPGHEWQPVNVDLQKLKEECDEKLATGKATEHTFLSYIFQALFREGYGGQFDSKKLDNELLGVKGITEEDLEKIMKPYLLQQQGQDSAL